MKIKHVVIGIGVLSVAFVASGCKDERDEICALSWAEHGLEPGGRIYAGQNGYDVADMDGDGWIIKPEFDNYCTVTTGLSNEQLIELNVLAYEAKSIGQE